VSHGDDVLAEIELVASQVPYFVARMNELGQGRLVWIDEPA